MKKRILKKQTVPEINDADLDFTKNPGDENASNPFLHSLDKLSEKDIESTTTGKAKTKKKRKGSLVTNVVLIISCGVFVVCAIYLAFNLWSKKQGADTYDKMAATYFDGISFADGDAVDAQDAEEDRGAVKRLSKISSASRVLCLSERIALGSDVVSGNYDEQLQQMRASLTALKEQNPDTYGWITIPGTRINHPVTQSGDNEWYLNHMYNGEYNVCGSIFADYRNDKTIYRNFNTVLYGHNVTDGNMFHDVEKFYRNDDNIFYDGLIYVYTMDGVYVYEPFAVFESRSDYNYFRTEFATTDEFIAFAEEMNSNSVHEKEMDFVRTDRMITLSTCTNGAATQRYCLQAKLVQVIS